MRTGKRLLIGKCRAAAFATLFLSLLTFNVSEALSQESPEGKGYGALMRLYGPPVEKQEYEVRRREIWLYPEHKVYIEHGKVVHVAKREKTTPAAPLIAPAVSEKPETSEVVSSNIEARVAREEVSIDDLLSAVQAAGEPDEGSSSKARGRGNPNINNRIQRRR